ncbi:MAG: apolipoprotein N-acyltransferase, partial [Cyanothece sp. SIO2G6]|nr:apolipoprotein N-acyltransferase [Cyanothece sp. SIO2G6]
SVSLAIALCCWAIVTLWGCLWSVVWAIGFTTILRFTGVQPGLLAMVTRVLVGTSLWCGLDTLWSQGILYWPTVALTQSPNNLWLLQLNQLSGPSTTTALIVAVNGLLAEALFLRQVLSLQPRPALSPSLAQLSRSTALLMALALGAIAHGVGAWIYVHPTLPSPAPDNPVDTSLAIGLIQGNVPTRIKLTRAGIQQALNRYTTGYGELVSQGADLVVLPEGAIPLLWDASKINPVAEAVGDRHIPALIGTFALATTADIGQTRSSAITQSLLMVVPATPNDALTPPDEFFPESGPVSDVSVRQSASPGSSVRVMSQYNKVKLVPLGEYIPAAGILGAIVTRLSPIQSTMIPGTPNQVLQTPWGVAIAGICYESAFPELFRQQTLKGGEFIITAANNDPYSGAMMTQHHAQDVMRAIESDRWMVRVTNTGYSGVVSPRGDTVWRSQRNQPVTHLASIKRRQSRTLYVHWGNWLTPVLISLAGIMVMIQRLYWH